MNNLPQGLRLSTGGWVHKVEIITNDAKKQLFPHSVSDKTPLIYL